MSFTDIRTFTFFTNPKELREIADKMEQQIKKDMKCGDNVPVAYVECIDSGLFKVSWDQSK